MTFKLGLKKCFCQKSILEARIIASAKTWEVLEIVKVELEQQHRKAVWACYLIPLSIGNCIKNCDLTFGEKWLFHLYPQCNRTFFVEGGPKKRLKNLLRLNFFQGPLSSFQRRAHAGIGEGKKYILLSQSFTLTPQGKPTMVIYSG